MKFNDSYMNILNYLNRNAEKILLASYVIFLASLSLEWEVNIFRTILLLAFLNYGFFNKNVMREVLSNNTLKLALIFPAIALIGWMISHYHANGLKTFDWIMYIIFGIGTTLIWKEKSILLLLVIPLTCLIASVSTLSWAYINSMDSSFIFTKDNRLFLYMDSKNRLGLLLAIASAICIGSSFLYTRFTIHLTTLALGLSYANWLTQSRASVFAILGVIILSIVYALRQYKRPLITISLFGFLVALFVTGSSFLKGRIFHTIMSLDFSYLLNGRDDIWLASWEIFLKSPLVGHGVNSFHDALSAHLALPENTGRFPAIRSQYTFWNAHQMVLGILCETGLAGLAAFTALIVRGIRTGLARLPESLPLLLMLAAFMVHGIGSYGFHRSWNSAIFFLPLGILEGMRLLSGEEFRLGEGSCAGTE